MASQSKSATESEKPKKMYQPRPQEHLLDAALRREAKARYMEKENISVTEELDAKLKLMQQIQDITGTKQVGKCATLKDWNDQSNIAAESIALMRHFGMNSFNDTDRQRFNDKQNAIVNNIDIPKNGIYISHNGIRKFPILLDEKFFEAKPTYDVDNKQLEEEAKHELEKNDNIYASMNEYRPSVPIEEQNIGDPELYCFKEHPLGLDLFPKVNDIWPVVGEPKHIKSNSEKHFEIPLLKSSSKRKNALAQKEGKYKKTVTKEENSKSGYRSQKQINDGNKEFKCAQTATKGAHGKSGCRNQKKVDNGNKYPQTATKEAHVNPVYRTQRKKDEGNNKEPKYAKSTINESHKKNENHSKNNIITGNKEPKAQPKFEPHPRNQKTASKSKSANTTNQTPNSRAANQLEQLEKHMRQMKLNENQLPKNKIFFK